MCIPISTSPKKSWRKSNSKKFIRKGGCSIVLDKRASTYRVMGIDPGLGATGYGIIEASGRTPSLVEAGVIRSRAKDPLEKKLFDIFKSTAEIIEEFDPAIVVIEELYSAYTHPRTAILMGHARGVIYIAAAARNLPVISYASTRIKNSLTGHGRASKEQVQRMVQHAFGLRQVPNPPDVADALAVALCHHNVLLHGVSSPRIAGRSSR